MIKAIWRRVHNKRHEKVNNFVFPMLLCKCCCWAGFQIVPIWDSTYQSDCENSNRWWDTDFITGFTTLVAHESHLDCHMRSIKTHTWFIVLIQTSIQQSLSVNHCMPMWRYWLQCYMMWIISQYLKSIYTGDPWQSMMVSNVSPNDGIITSSTFFVGANWWLMAVHPHMFPNVIEGGWKLGK